MQKALKMRLTYSQILFAAKPERIQFVTNGHTTQNNIKTDLKETVLQDIDSFVIAQTRDR